MSELRQTTRVACEILLNKSNDGHTHVCLASNISLGGMRIQRLLDPMLEFQDYVRLQFQLPGTRAPIWIGAKKVYEQEDYIGLSFVYFKQESFARLRNWILSAQQDDQPVVEVKVA